MCSAQHTVGSVSEDGAGVVILETNCSCVLDAGPQRRADQLSSSPSAASTPGCSWASNCSRLLGSMSSCLMSLHPIGP